MIRQLRICFLMAGLILSLTACSWLKPSPEKAAPVVDQAALVSIDEALAKMPADTTQEGDALYAALIADAPESVVTICDRLVPPGTGDDTKAHFAIESLARYVMRDGAEKERRAYVEGILKSLGKADDKDIKAFLIRKLEVAGRNESVDMLASFLTDDRLCEPATRALVRIGTSKAQAALHKALPLSQDKRRITLIQAMGVLKISKSVPTLVSFNQGKDPEVRQAALDALASIGDPDCESLLAQAMNTDDLYMQNHAQANYLRYARSLAENGHEKQAMSVLRQILGASASASQSHIRSGALEAMATIDSDVALDKMVDAMDSPYMDYRMAALQQAEKIPGRAVTLLWVDVMNEAAPVVQTEIIGMLGRRDDTAALTAVLEAIGSDEPGVCLAAIDAAPRLGGEKAIPALVDRLATADKDETQAIKDQLARMPGDNPMASLADLLPDQLPAAKVVLMDVLAARQASGQSNAVMIQTADTDKEVRTSAIKAMADVASPDNIPGLIDLLFATTSPSEAKAIRKSIVAAANRAEDPQTGSVVILQRLANAEESQKLSLLPVLSGIGGEQALKTVLTATHSSDEAMQNTALRTLTDWPDADAADPLLAIVKSDASLTHKVLALRGFVRLAKSDQVPADRKVDLLVKAMNAAPRPEDKQFVMGALSELRTLEAFAVIASQMENDDMQTASAQAVVQIACPRNDKDPGLRGIPVVTALRRAGELVADNDMRKQCETHIATILAEEGYQPLFNGRDLTGWKGLLAPPNDNPINRAKLSPADYAKAQTEADKLMQDHWMVQDGMLVFDGKGLSLVTARDYGDFEMLVDWKILPKGDSGIYLRGAPQVQIWDFNENPVGSGGLYNNQKNTSKPLVCADRPIGQWNTFHIKMIGDRVTVHLNGQVVVDNVVMENYWDRNQPIFSTGQIELQNHGNNLYFRNVYLKEIPRKGLARPLFNGRDLAGWEQVGGAPGNWAIENGVLYTTGKGGGWLSTVETFDDFDLSLDFRVPANGNSGVFLRTPRQGDPAYVGMEIQVLDDYADMYAKLQPFQYTGSIYGLSAPSSRVSRHAGEWQTMRIRCEGPHVQVWLNGQQIQDANLGDYADQVYKHPGIERSGGYIGMQDHGARVEYRNIMIEELVK